MLTTWTQNGNLYLATNKNGMPVGRVRIMLAKTERPFLAVSENGMTKQFALLHHAKDWVEELYTDVADAIESEQ
jgi:hypothetical protein